MNDVILLYKYVHSLAVLADVRSCVINHCVSVNKFVMESKTGSDLFDILVGDCSIKCCRHQSLP